MATSTGILKTVYDPKTGREFNSPAQAAQYGVKDYVTSLPKNIPLPASTQKVVDEWKIRNPNLTQDEILGVLGGYYSMTGEQFRNYEIQGTIRSADQQIVRNSVATQSGGLAPEQLTAKLQAFKIKPPTTAQEKLQQDALYADYANRYANSSWNYANMGGKPQDFSLKPADYLATSFTGYSEPINFALSNMNQSSPQFAELSKILTANPEINDVIDQLYKQNPNASIFNSINPKYAGGTEKSTMASNFNVTIKNLAGDIERFGSAEAMRRFTDQQKTTANAVAQTAGGLLQTTQPPVTMAAPPATQATQAAQSAALTYALNNGMSADQYYKRIFDYVANNQNMTDTQLRAEMDRLGVSPQDVAKATGVPVDSVLSRYNASKATTAEEIAVQQKAQADLAARQAQWATQQKANESAWAAQQAKNATDWAAQQKLTQNANSAYANAPQTLGDKFTSYQSIPIGAQYNPAVTAGGVSPYSQVMSQMQPFENPYASFVPGTPLGGYNPNLYSQIAVRDANAAAAKAAADAQAANNALLFSGDDGGAAAAAAAAASAADSAAASAASASGTAPGTSPGGDAPGSGAAMGGLITSVWGEDPPGPDDGAKYLDIGEYVIKKSSVNKYGRGLLDMINEGRIPSKRIRSLLD